VEGNERLLLIDPLIARIVQKILKAVAQLGIERWPHLPSVPVAQWRAYDAIEMVRFYRETTADEYLGLGVAPCTRGAYAFILNIASRCATLREALAISFRFMSLVTVAVRFRLVEESRHAIIEITEAESQRDPEHALSDWSLVVWNNICQWLIGVEMSFDRTELDHALDASYRVYTNMFGCDCVFNGPTARLIFDRSYLDRRVVKTPAQAALMLAKAYGYVPRPNGLARTWRQQILDVFCAQLRHGEPPSTIEELAGEFGVSGQTLRRRLKAEGVSYRSLKASARWEMASNVLITPNATLSKASLAGGLAEGHAPA
jgi:AraC-like DNA-binding protein